MTHADQSYEHERVRPQPQPQPRARQRGGSASAIAGALHRAPHPGPQHWGGPRPRRADPDTFFRPSLGPRERA